MLCMKMMSLCVRSVSRYLAYNERRLCYNERRLCYNERRLCYNEHSSKKNWSFLYVNGLFVCILKKRTFLLGPALYVCGIKGQKIPTGQKNQWSLREEFRIQERNVVNIDENKLYCHYYIRRLSWWSDLVRHWTKMLSVLITYAERFRNWALTNLKLDP